MSIISLKNISYTYPLEKEATIKDFSFDFEAGKVYGIIGENQAGKTTLCNIMRGFIPGVYRGQLSGEVKINGQTLNPERLCDLAATIGYSFQNPFTQISGVKETVFEEIAYGMENLGVAREQMIQKVNELLHLFKLEDIQAKNPFELSGGQKQRVALAVVVALDPEIIILDEPTSQLDPQSTEEIFEIIALLKKQGKTVVLVEHKVDLLAKYCDEILVIKDGKLALFGTTAEVFSNAEVLKYGGQLPQVALLYLTAQKRGLLATTSKVCLTVEECYEYLKMEG